MQAPSVSLTMAAALSAQARTVFADIIGLLMIDGTIENEQPATEEAV